MSSRSRSVRTLLQAAGLVLACASTLVATSGAARAQQFTRFKRECSVEQKLDHRIPLDLAFTDETGKAVKLGDYFGEKPVVLTLVYFECPMLCSQILNGLVSCLKHLSLDAGKDFQIVTVSINPHETPELAARKKAAYIEALGIPAAGAGWHFLTTTDDAAIHALADSIGFRYFYDEEIHEYAHPGVVTILTPEGKVARYFSDVGFSRADFTARDVSFSLIEASENRIGSWIDQIFLRCYHYDPITGKYGLVVTNVVRLLALATVTCLVGFIVVMLRRERGSLPPATS
jgi:protein SCO1/2